MVQRDSDFQRPTLSGPIVAARVGLPVAEADVAGAAHARLRARVGSNDSPTKRNASAKVSGRVGDQVLVAQQQGVSGMARGEGANCAGHVHPGVGKGLERPRMRLT